jgi:hypothetical protein
MIALGPTTQVSLIKHEATIIVNLNIGKTKYSQNTRRGEGSYAYTSRMGRTLCTIPPLLFSKKVFSEYVTTFLHVWKRSNNSRGSLCI